jgi:hypothetical protein
MALPIAFSESNGTLSGGPAARYGTADDVLDLSVCRVDGQIISCWRLSWRERVEALLFGRVWLHVWSERTHAPVGLQAKRNIFTAAPAAEDGRT